MNVDGMVDFDDIKFFVLGFEDPQQYKSLFGMEPSISGDTNNDGHFDFDDINGFTSILEGPGQVVVGDMDVNGVVDFDDIEFFVLGLEEPQEYEALFGTPPSVNGDTNDDGDLDFDDIEGFASLLALGPTGSESQSVPQPSTLALSCLGLAWLAIIFHERR